MTTRHYVAGLSERVLDLMSDGEKWTAPLLANALGISVAPVSRALWERVAEGEVHMPQRDPDCGGARTYRQGQSPRNRACKRGAVKASKRLATQWPDIDPVIPAAFRAIAVVG